MISNDVIKTMIELSSTEEEADGIIEEFTTYRKPREKCDYLLDQFKDRGISIFGRFDGEDGDPDLTDYQAVLCAVVNMKWR
jgi:hypothetical protein